MSASRNPVSGLTSRLGLPFRLASRKHPVRMCSMGSAAYNWNGFYASRIDAQQHTVDRRLAQIDGAIEESTRRGKTKTAMAAMEGQQRARSSLVDERDRA